MKIPEIGKEYYVSDISIKDAKERKFSRIYFGRDKNNKRRFGDGWCTETFAWEYYVEVIGA